MTVECNSCGSTYTDRYARVFGDNNDELQRCGDCAGVHKVGLGAGAGLETTQRLASRKARGGGT